MNNLLSKSHMPILCNTILSTSNLKSDSISWTFAFNTLNAFWGRECHLSHKSKSSQLWHLFFWGIRHRLEHGELCSPGLCLAHVYGNGDMGVETTLPMPGCCPSPKAWGVMWATEHMCTMEQSQCVILNSDYWVICNRPQKDLQNRHALLVVSISIYQSVLLQQC